MFITKRRTLIWLVLICLALLALGVALHRRSLSKHLTPAEEIKPEDVTVTVLVRLRIAAFLDGENARAHHSLALVHLYRGDSAKAERAARRAVELAPNQERFWETWGRACLYSGRYADAISHLEKAVALGSDNRQVRLKLAAAFFHNGDWERALEEYSTLLAQGPPQRGILRSTFSACEAAGRYEEGLSIAENSLRGQIDDRPFAEYWQARFLNHLGRREEAAPICARVGQAAERTMDRSNAFLLLARIRLEQGNVEAAEAAYQQARDLRPLSWRLREIRELLDRHKGDS